MKKLLAFTASLGLALSLIALPRTPAAAGALLGPRRAVDTVLSDTRDVYHITFRAGERAHVWAAGNGDIDLLIYDEYGHLVAADRDYDWTPDCYWTPRWTGEFTIKVVNCEDYNVRYVLHTN